MILRIAIITLILFTAACDRSSSHSSSDEGEPKKANVLQEYINVPKDRARGAKNKVEAAQNALDKQAESLDE